MARFPPIWEVLAAIGALLALCATLALVARFPQGTARAASSERALPAGNLLIGDQAGFDYSTGGWVGTGATLSWVASVGDAYPGALGVTATGGSGMAAASGSPSSGGLSPAVPGEIYGASAAIEAVGASESAEPVITFYSSSGSILSAVFGPATEAVTGSWTEQSPVSAVAPTGTTAVALFVDVANTQPGQEVYIDDAWIEGAPDAAAPVVGPLHTSGNQIVQADGVPVVFHGVNLWGLASSGSLSGTGVTQQAVIQARAWGANFVRVPLGEQFWVASNCDYVPTYEATIEQVVNWITSLGMVALLDLHFNTVGGCEAGAQHNMADEAEAPTFWNQVATEFGSNPLVAFDLYNEPHDISDSVWLNGGTTTDAYAPNQTYVAAGMQQLYDTVRSTGAQNLIFISGNNWANTVPSTLVSGTNIVYAAHAYTCPDAPPPTCTTPDPYDPSSILGNWVGLSASLPVMVTEFGWPGQNDGTYNANVISFAQSEGWGWSAYAFEELQYPTIWDLTSAWLDDGTAEPAPSGMPVLCALEEDASGLSVCSSPPPEPPPVSLPAPTTTSTTPPTTTSSPPPITTTTTTPASSGSGAAGLAYDGLVPSRICDTRTSSPANQCRGHSLGPGASLTVDMPASVPTTAGAVVVNVTVVAGPGAQGYLTAFPAGQGVPPTANLTFTDDQLVGNLVTVGLGTDLGHSDSPAIGLYNGSKTGTVDVVVDLEGYYAAAVDTPAGEYHQLQPTRIADTRCASGCAGEDIPAANSKLTTAGPSDALEVQVTGVGGIPSSGVEAVVANLAVTDTTAPSYATVWPTGSAQPLASSSNWTAGETWSSQVVVEVGQDGQISIFNDAGRADFVVDVDGYFSSSSGTEGSLFEPTAPTRVIGTSEGAAPTSGGTSITASVAGEYGVPQDATGVVLNVTDVSPSSANYLTVYPAGSPVPTAADVNYVPQDPFNVITNATYAELGSAGEVAVFDGPDNGDTAGVVADVFGFFAPAG